MKKGKKRIFIWLGIVIGAVILAFLTFGLIFYLQIRKMTPAETGPVNDSVFCIKDNFVDVYLFRGTDGYLLVDAGFGMEGMAEGLQKLGIRPEEIRSVLLTHADGDHIGGLGLFPDAGIYMHTDEEQMVNGMNEKFIFSKYIWEYGPYTLFNSNDTFSLGGWHVQVIHTPGHTPGSCCFLIGGDYLLTGDNTLLKNGKFEHFVSFFNMDTETQEISIQHLPDPNSVKYILTAHHGVFRN